MGGDNYLIDHKDITNPKCNIVLADFGTACNIEPDQRLNVVVGTQIFWAPEIFEEDYGSKVDVWAMGIVTYGMVSGRFPFKDPNEIKTKEVDIPEHVGPLCRDFIMKMLDKK